MPCQLPADCLNEIFEYLEEFALHSCLLVNRLWCKISIRILWRDIWDFKHSISYRHQSRISSKILSTLVACLPDESKEILYKNSILISTPTSNPPLFNYPAFCKVLSINDICQIIYMGLNIKSSTSLSLNCLVVDEFIKMFTNQNSSLKRLTYSSNYIYNITLNDISYTCFSGVNLVNLSELRCSSDINSEFYYQLSQTCHNLQLLAIDFEPKPVSNELKGLISSQKNLKNLRLSAFNGGDWTDILSSLIKHSNTLTKLYLTSDNGNLPLSFVASFPNLQQVELSFFCGGVYSKNFESLQYATFPKLQILNIPDYFPEPEYVINFLRINGKNLEKIYFFNQNNVLNLSIAELCPNLKKVFVIFNDDELDTLRTIFNSCRYLESIKFYCGKSLLSEKEILEIVAEHSPENFYELKIYNRSNSNLLPEELENFFISWKSRTSKKSLSLIIIKHYNYNSLEINEENMKIINHYKNSGVINFKIRGYEDDDS
ncbi:hypothetical protein C1645_832444 [Glomus cerebriforme]|uniref:F-box domain-containing protein n=1 Tax=Glomus cerebriforme TaxID=658196 RepID=A0A397SDI3_9GLOM|nr:hypothetical protein C1645_832444 [Glomus cerebriforme]